MGRPSGAYTAYLTITGVPDVKKFADNMKVVVRNVRYKMLNETVPMSANLIKMAFFTAGYYKPPYDTGALLDSVRCRGVEASKNTMYRNIIAGGVQRRGKKVTYAAIVHEGWGYHKSPRRFMRDGITQNWHKIVQHITAMTYESLIEQS